MSQPWPHNSEAYNEAFTLSRGHPATALGYTHTKASYQGGMAATAKHDHVRGKFATEPEEDIAAIAKQISDHAEAIYQTWKSRGLAPTEILNCHNSDTAADTFGSALTPQQAPVMDLLSNTSSNLEQLVNTFVSEDKARLAARRNSPNVQAKTLPSSIQFALQKFEKKSNEPVSPVKPGVSLKPTVINQPSRIGVKSPQALHHKEIFLETIETSFPEEMNQKKDSNASSGLTTWPLKNKSGDNRRVIKGEDVVDRIEPLNKYATIPSNGKNTAEYLDEVAREEERLINALKTGIILTEDPKSTNNGDSTSSPKKKSTILLKKQKEKSPAKKEKETDVKEDLQNMSIVDYAKVRYRAAQEGVSAVAAAAANAAAAPTTAAASPRVRARAGGHPPTLEPHPGSAHRSRANGNGVAAGAVAGNPVRPFLTRGSVAERVLIFEKCPTEIMMDSKRRAPGPAAATWRCGAVPGDVQSKAQTYSRDKDFRGANLPHTTLQRHARNSRSLLIPRFYYPQGKPILPQHLDLVLKKVQAAFETFPNQQVARHNFGAIAKAADCPLYWKVPLFVACGGEKYGFVDSNTFLEYWRNLCSTCFNQSSKFISILTRGKRSYLSPEDLIPLVQDVVETHPGLTFLKEATEFHSRYVHTVIARIYYCVNRSWSGRISLAELRRSNLLSIIKLLEEEDDINAITAYFSYEHFYVIYCKFWELDRDHDLLIDRHDLARHSDHALSSRMIERIFSGAVTRGGRHASAQDKMSYTEFVWFLLSEEDKTHPTAIEYWFRCMDLDGDGYLSMYELEYFYEEQLQRMDAIGMETLPFEDCLCQMLDMIHPEQPGKISLSDLKRCKMTSIFFDTFFNLEKYLDHEQRDPFAQRDHDNEGREMSDWDRYAAEEYELLVAEEGAQDHQDDRLLADSDGEDSLSPNLDQILAESSKKKIMDRLLEPLNNMWTSQPYMNGNSSKPSLTVTDFDYAGVHADDSDDYAGESEEDEPSL